MKLIFLHGLPGVGKLTVARALGELTGFGVFHNHLTVDLVGAVFEFGSPPFVELRCSPEELERRIEQPSRQGSGKLNSARRFRELSEAGAFVTPGIPEARLVVDMTDIGAPDAARFITSELGLA